MLTYLASDGVGTTIGFVGPNSVSMDASQNIIVTQPNPFSTVRMINSIGVSTTLAGNAGGYAEGIGTNALFLNPFRALRAPNGNIIVADFTNARVRSISPSNVVSTLVRCISFSFDHFAIFIIINNDLITGRYGHGIIFYKWHWYQGSNGKSS
jgi:hypothetical protein